MKKFFNLSGAIVVLAMVVSGCSSISPYDYADNWLIRENDIPQYYSTFDLFYIGEAPAIYGDTHEVQLNWVKTHTNDIFGNRVRVFAPAAYPWNEEKAIAALQYYLDHFHQEGHPFVLMAEGKFADLLYQAIRENAKVIPENGFIAAYLPDMTPKSTEEIVEDFYWKKLKTAESADDFGVIVSWTSCINNDDVPEADGQAESYNINPVNWMTDGTPGTADENIAAVFYMPEYKNNFSRKVEEKNFCGAKINLERGVLEISCPPQLLHSADGRFSDNSISIFAKNIAANAFLRTQTLVRTRQWKELK